MTYAKQTWTDNVTQVDATHMNHIEAGIALAPGTELDYAQITANVATAAGAPGTAVVTGHAVTYDGATRIKIEFYAPGLDTGSSGTEAMVLVQEDGVVLGRIIDCYSASAGEVISPVYGALFRTPSAGSHTYVVSMFRNGGTGTPTVYAGAGGGSTIYEPAFLRVTVA